MPCGNRAKDRKRPRSPRSGGAAVLRNSLTKTKILIVHETGLVRCGVRYLVASSERFEVCDDTDDALSARELFLRHRPKIVVLSLMLRVGDGVQLIKEFRKMDPAAAILVVSACEDAMSIQRAFRAGARGYLTIYDGALELLRALDSISTGNVYVNTALWPVVLKNFANGKMKPAGSELEMLSDRELQVFRLIGRGLGASELAKQIHVSVKTVETHEMRIKGKLGLHSAAELREKATRWTTKSHWKRTRPCPERLHAENGACASRRTSAALDAGVASRGPPSTALKIESAL